MSDAEAQEMLRLGGMEMSAKKKRVLETASVQIEHQPTVVSSTLGANILNNLDKLTKEYEEKSNQTKTFIGDIAKEIEAKRKGSGSQYATFETKNGKIVTIRLSNHNAKVSNFDNNDEKDGISIVVSAKGNNGIINDGDAHIVEYYYDAIKLRRAEGKPLADIVRSIKQALYSGEFEDTTGLAERQEVNLNNPEFHIVYHGSGAKFDAFDHSHMGEGEGAQEFGWGTYVTSVKGIAKNYARQNPRIYHNGEEVKAYEVGYLDDAKKYASTIYYKLGMDDAIDFFDEILAEQRKDYPDSPRLKVYEEAKRLLQEDKWEKSPGMIYTVEIPDDNGSNYLNHDKVVSSQEIARVKQRLFDILSQGQYKGAERELREELNGVFAPGLKGNELYNNVSAYLGGNKQASQFLNEMGYVGIKYPSNYMRGGNTRGQRNYVIFNEADANITKRVEFLKTPQGEVYGWSDGKKIYLTEKGMNPETPIHEYTHIWARAMKEQNAEGWQSVKDLLRGTSMWNEVMNDANYADIRENEDAVASEVLSRLSGKENAKRMESEAQRMIDEAKGIMAKAEAVTLVERMRKALNEFWSWVGKSLFDIKEFGSIEEVTDRVLYDLVNNTELETSEGVIEKQVVSDPKLIAELDASPKRIGYRNVVMNEDGTFGSPMASGLRNKGKGKVKTSSFAMGEWEQAEENPDLANENGKINLVKPDGKSVDQVDYNPYIHNRVDKVNAQFKQAWERPNLVYVETEIPLTDLESGYHAEKAKLPVGIHSWSNGDLILSRYDKPTRIVPWEEVADDWVERFGDRGVEFDIVPPALLPILAERGVEILPPHKGMGKNCVEAYEEWKAEQEEEAKYSLRDNKKTSQGKRSGAVAGTTLSKGLKQERSEHLSRHPLSSNVYNANLAQNTQIAKNKIRKKKNEGGINIEGNTPNDIVRGIGKTIGLQKSNSSNSYYQDYYEGDYEINGNTVRVRLSQHPANAERIGSAPTDNRISIVVYKDGEHRGEVIAPYSEYIYNPEVLDKEYIVDSILNGLESLLNGNGFVVDETQVERKDYKPEGETKYSLRGDDSLSTPDRVIARETYERMVANGRYQFTEAMQDSMMGLKLLYKAILGKKMQVENIPDFENAYIAENLMSSQNAAMQQEYYIKFMKPLVKAINTLGGKDKAKRQAIIDYLMAKHGLERNQVMAQRDAKATADEVVIKNVGFSCINLRVQDCCSYGRLSLQCKSK